MQNTQGSGVGPRSGAGLVRSVFPGKQVELAGISGSGFFGGRERKFETEPVREALAGFGRESFEVIVHEAPDTAGVAKMALDL
jgi:hypothetical protein